jgi:6-phosphogluconolactonase
MVNRKLEIYDNLEKLSAAAAKQLQDIALASTAARGRFLLALSGGSTPSMLYEILSKAPYRESLPWNSTHIFWNDERCLPPSDRESNFGQVDRLLLSHVEIPAENIHRIRGEEAPENAAQEYARTIRRFASGENAWPRFDLSLLGLGADGHTASLFPGPITKKEQLSAVMAVSAPAGVQPEKRVTLTPLVINLARRINFMIAGEEKAKAVEAAIMGSWNPEKNPTQRIIPEAGNLTWMLDAAAGWRLAGK